MNHDYVNDDGDRIKEFEVPSPGVGATTYEVNVSVLMRPGPRYTSNKELLRIQEELQAQGVELDNPARPIDDRIAVLEDPEKVRRLIEAEIESATPDREWIGRLNQHLSTLQEADS